VNTTTSEADPAVLFIPGGMTLTVRGGAGTGTNGGKAAISLPSGGCLYVRGAGTLDVYGGSGAATTAWQGQSAMRAGGEGWSREADGGYDVWAGRGGVSSTGSGGGGAGIGTDGGAGGAAVGVSSTDSVKGHYSPGRYSYDYLTEASGINGAAGGRGVDTAEGGALYVLDAARVSGAGGAGGAIEGSPAPAGRFIDENETGYPGGGGGGGGRGGSGALVGSGGAGGGGGGSGGSGGVSRHVDYPYGYLNSYGGGGLGGTGAPNGLSGAGTRNNLGGYGGAGGAAGVSGYGGAVTVAESASFSQTASYGPINGITANLIPIDTGSNSTYWLTFEENRPDAASGVLSLPTPNPAEATAGVTYPSPLAASLTGWRFTGFYTSTAAVGVRVIDDAGRFVANAGGADGLYTTRNGSWCYPGDATLYAQWAPGVFTVALQAGAATTPGAAALYEKYDAGWYADASCAGPTIAAIATPERTGYFFEGYYTAPSGGGNPAIGADGGIRSAFNEFPQGVTLYAYWTPVAELVEVTVKLDDNPYTGRNVALYQSGALRYKLDDPDDSGVYAYYQDDRGKPGYGVASGGYELYVDGLSTGRAVAVLGATVDDVELDYYTATVTTGLDGDPSRVAAVSLRSDTRGAVPLVWDDSYNNFSAPLYLDPEGGGANVWEVYADGADTGFDLDMNDEDMREATIPYYNATLDVMYEKLWTGASVTLRQGGAVRHYLPYATNSAIGGDVVSTYQMAVMGDTGTDTYDVFVNGLDTGETLTLVAEDKGGVWTASATYYAAAVDVLRNDAAWAGADVELWKGGAHVQTLGYDTTEETYLAPYVQKRGVDEPYDVRVLSGSISGADTEETITGAVTTAAVAYYDVAYRNRGADYLIQIVRDGQTAARPADPYQVGVTFRDWLTEGGTPYDFGEPVTDAVTLHADFDAPKLNIGGYMKCDDDGTENGGTGGYYRMANLSIRGFPLAGKPMSAAKLYVTNGAVTFLSEDGYKISNEIDETTGNGIVSILFTGDPDDPGDKVSADTAQQFLREKVIVEVKDKAVRHRLRASVFGTTN
jgi:hypothetical protein